jgi:hypothetical protein
MPPPVRLPEADGYLKPPTRPDDGPDAEATEAVGATPRKRTGGPDAEIDAVGEAPMKPTGGPDADTEAVGDALRKPFGWPDAVADAFRDLDPMKPQGCPFVVDATDMVEAIVLAMVLMVVLLEFMFDMQILPVVVYER